MRKAKVVFPAMGSDCSISVYMDEECAIGEAEELAHLGARRARLLHECWTRFDALSELSQMNSFAGNGPLHVSEDLWVLVNKMREAWKITGGLYDPTVHGAMVKLGYDRTLTAVSWQGDKPVDSSDATPGMGAVVLDSVSRTVDLPNGVALDPGGIGKGLAGDIISTELHQTGARGVMVSLGGDIVARGFSGALYWSVGLPNEEGKEIRVPGGDSVTFAVATSGMRSRQWGKYLYHIVDPVTGVPADSPISKVTVFAGAGWLAEAQTKAILLSGKSAEGYLSDRENISALIQWSDGGETTYGFNSQEVAHV